MKLVQKTITVIILGSSLAACGTTSHSRAPALNPQNASAPVRPQITQGRGTLTSAAVGTLLGASLGKTVGASLTENDLTYYKSASQNALETAKTGTSSSWKNPDTGTYGTITLIRTYETGGQYCREYTQTFHIEGKTEEGYGKACRQKDGNWRVG